MRPGMPNTLEEKDWNLLLRRIKEGKCTPFLGAGACEGVLPLGSTIAREWAKKHCYPLADSSDLAHVAQFLAVQNDPMFPKEEILEWFRNIAPPNFTEPDEPHSLLAELPLRVYITTNYDDFMVQALKSRSKDPRRELCRWNKFVKNQPSALDSYDPTPAQPVVFHLHGHNEVPESLGITEAYYLDFLVNISKDKDDLLPHQIQRALAGTSLLFIGYSLADWSFRVLFRGIMTATERSLRRMSVTVQLLPVPTDALEATRQGVQTYLDKYFNRTDIRVYWGTAREFSTELRQRWRDFSHGA
jgi:hypothetical protein